MIYLGSNEIAAIKLGNTDISAIYAGDLLIWPTSVTGWSVEPSTIEMEASGGTENIRITSLSAWTISSSENWVTFSQNSGDSGRTTVVATIGENSGDTQRTATITVTDGTNTSTIGVTQYVCNPLVIAQHSGNTNNQGYSAGTNFYLFDSGLTAITPCEFDFTGIKSICHRTDGGFAEKYPAASLGSINQSNLHLSTGCMLTIEYFEADCSTVETLHYCFGNDREAGVSQTLTCVTLYNTDNVTHIGDFCYYNRNLKEVHLGSLTSVTKFEANSFNSSNVSLTGFTVDALPDIDLDFGLNSCTALTVNSLVNILNALPITAVSGRYIRIGSTNMNKLSAAQLAIATNKGWTVN